jgi:hypothetical protein
MKKIVYSITAFFMVVLCSAQMTLTQAEYFWDTDPGLGLGTAIQATDGSFNSTFENLSKTGITLPSVGLHKFCIRVKDTTGQWGPVFMNVVEVQQGGSAIMAIAQAEYFWDTDPGLGLGTPVLATDGNFNSTFEQLTKTGIALPALGLHVFNIRVKDNTGQWGPVFRNVVSVQASLKASQFDLTSLAVYPNPVKDILNVSIDTTITAVALYNLLGQQLMTKAVNANEYSIDVSGLSSGTYLVRVTSGNAVKTLKIIKE